MAGFSLFTDLISPTKYSVPDAATVDIDQEQLANVRSNASTFEAAKQLAQQYNDFMAEQVSNRLKANFPQFEGLQTAGADVIAKRLAGVLSTSDAAGVQRRSAARGLGLGVAGSPAGGALTLRDLGIAQYQAQTQGLNDLGNFTQTVLGAKNAPLFDFSNVFMTPQQRIATQFQNKTNQWNVQNLRNQMAVQPEPWMKALAGFGDSLLTAAGSYFTMGGFGGGGGGGSPSRSNFTVGDYMQQSRMDAEASGGWNSPNFNTGDAQALAQYGLY